MGESAFSEANYHGHDIFDRAQFVATNTNDVLRNSGILNKRVRVTFHEDPYNIPGGVPTGGLRPAINAFRSDPIAQQLRDFYKADMVYYIGGWPEMTVTQGEAYSIDTPAPNTYAIGNYAATFHYFTATHELGHLWGCYHQNSGSCSKGYALDQIDPDGKQIQTVMHQNEGASDRRAIPYFSNPAVKYLNEPTGVVGNYECANEVSESMCRFADFRDTKELEVLIAQDENTPCYSGTSLQASVTFPAVGVPGASVQSYEWRYSFSPIFSGSNVRTVFSTDPSAFLPASIHYFKQKSRITVYVQLQVTTSDGVVTTWIEAVELCPRNEDVLGPATQYPLTLNSLIENEINVFPNPVSSSSRTIWLTSTQSTQLHLTLTNTIGQHLENYNIDASKAAQPVLLPANLPAGLYYLNTLDNSGNNLQSTIQLTR